jgi:hypothetical protein
LPIVGRLVFVRIAQVPAAAFLGLQADDDGAPHSHFSKFEIFRILEFGGVYHDLIMLCPIGYCSGGPLGARSFLFNASFFVYALRGFEGLGDSAFAGELFLPASADFFDLWAKLAEHLVHPCLKSGWESSNRFSIIFTIGALH